MMSGPTIAPEEALRLASFVEERRLDLVATVVRSTIVARPGSVAANAFANAFFDRFVAELRTGSAVALDGWAGSNEPAEAFDRVRVLLVACAAVSAAYGARFGQSDQVLLYLALRSSELEKRLSGVPANRPANAIDPASLVNRDEVVTSLLAALEARDAATCEHSRAVGMWCGRIAKMLGLSAEEQAFAALGGTLHDVGKIATPAEILLKAGPLDLQEWETMRTHAAVGGKMLERIPMLAEVAPIVRAHHERLDGRGYPDGLHGSAIPLAARIVSVADSFHAMISNRPYRLPLSVPRALAELRAGIGTQWDPLATGAMLQIIQPSGEQSSLHAAGGGLSG